MNTPHNVRLAPPPVFTVRGRPVRPWVALAAVLIGFSMAILDTTIVNIAIPSAGSRDQLCKRLQSFTPQGMRSLYRKVIN